MRKNPIKVLVVEPMKTPFTKEIDGSLSSLQDLVGGTIQIVYPFEDKACIVCNDEGKLLDLPPNRFLKDKAGNPYDVICGTLFVAGLKRDDLTSLTNKQIDVYTRLFGNEYVIALPAPHKTKPSRSQER